MLKAFSKEVVLPIDYNKRKQITCVDVHNVNCSHSINLRGTRQQHSTCLLIQSFLKTNNPYVLNKSRARWHATTGKKYICICRLKTTTFLLCVNQRFKSLATFDEFNCGGKYHLQLAQRHTKCTMHK